MGEGYLHGEENTAQMRWVASWNVAKLPQNVRVAYIFRNIDGENYGIP